MKFYRYVFLFCALFFSIKIQSLLADVVNLGGDDKLGDMTAAGSLIKTADNFLFNIVAKVLAGLAILSAGWNLKEQRFAMAIICVFGALIIASVPLWVENVFSIAGNKTLFAK